MILLDCALCGIRDFIHVMVRVNAERSVCRGCAKKVTLELLGMVVDEANQRAGTD